MNKHLAIFLFLSLIVLLAGFGRLIGFGSPHEYTWDEEFYVQMGDNLCKNPLDYNCLYFKDVFSKLGLTAPEYLSEPLFKHPPLFTYLVFMVYSVFKVNYIYAFFVSSFFGLALIIITYFLGSGIFGRRLGLAAAFLVAIDPVNWACSEKIWMETTLVALMWFSLYFIIKALTEKKYVYFYAAGLFSGLAMLTKYPALLVFPIGLNLALVLDKKSLRSRHFWAWPIIGLILFMPWLVWNYAVYGNGIFTKMMKLHEVKYFILLAPILLVAAITLLNSVLKTAKLRFIFIGALLLLLFSNQYMITGIANMLNTSYAPPTGWKSGMFHFEPHIFYFRRLIELSPFYLVSFLSLLFLAKPGSRERVFTIPALWGLAFYSIWGGYQSRYILFAVPALLILTCRAIGWCWKMIDEKINADLLKTVCKLILVTMVMFCLVKTVIIDIMIPLNNNYLYF